jgi:hypothetical protein
MVVAVRNPIEIDMTAEEANPELPAIQADRRGAQRCPCNLQPFWRFIGYDHCAEAPLRVRDISATGIGLQVKQPLKPGTALVINLQTRQQQLSRPLAVRVMHATLLADGDWLLGCQFVRRLSDQDMQELVEEE